MIPIEAMDWLAFVLANWADVYKAERLAGRQPQANFEEGVSRLVEWYRNNRDWAKEIQTD